MSDQTTKSKYLLGQEHITDRELDELYDFSSELKLQLDQFREYDKKYRTLENINTNESEGDRAAILSDCILVIGKITSILSEMQERSAAASGLFLKAKGALEEKLDIKS